MAKDPRAPDGKSDDAFGWGQQPLRRIDEATGDEGIEPTVGEGHDEATIGRSARKNAKDGAEGVHGYPTAPRGPDSQE